MKKSEFYFDLPKELIAQIPLENRDASRLLCLDRQTGGINHRKFSQIAELLRPGDLLVMNDSRVIPARLLGQKIPSGAAMEFLLLERKTLDTWEILVKPGRKAAVGTRFSFGGGLLVGEILSVLDEGNRLVRFYFDGEFYDVLERAGKMPLPPYITEELNDNERYQTVYSRELGSAAAPTAGLHFTPELLRKLGEHGVNTAFVTLHVGLGTFRPVKADVVEEHKMHKEHYFMPPDTAEIIAKTKAAGGRVVAVGTTSCRTLEAVAQKAGSAARFADYKNDMSVMEGYTDIFITPGYDFKAVDGLITNFHLPESTLIMLVSAFAGYANTMEAYREAIAERYRFFSFGDAMMIV